MLSKLGVEGNCLLKKPSVNIVFHGKKARMLSPKIGNRQGCLPSLLLVSIMLELLASAVRQEKVVKGIKNYQEVSVTTMRKMKPLFRCYLKSSVYLQFLCLLLACNL